MVLSCFGPWKCGNGRGSTYIHTGNYMQSVVLPPSLLQLLSTRHTCARSSLGYIILHHHWHVTYLH